MDCLVTRCRHPLTPKSLSVSSKVRKQKPRTGPFKTVLRALRHAYISRGLVTGQRALMKILAPVPLALLVLFLDDGKCTTEDSVVLAIRP